MWRMPEAITNQSLVHCHLVVDLPGNHHPTFTTDMMHMWTIAICNASKEPYITGYMVYVYMFTYIQYTCVQFIVHNGAANHPIKCVQYISYAQAQTMPMVKTS